MRINRPQVPTDIPIEGPVGWESSTPTELFPISSYVASGANRPGLLNNEHSANSDWHTVLNITSDSGVLSFCLFAADNNENATNTLSGRVTIDGTIVYNEAATVPANGGSGDFQAAIAAVGSIATERNGTPYNVRGMSLGHMPFETSCKIEIKTSDHVNMPVRTMYKYHLTGTPVNNRPLPPKFNGLEYYERWAFSVNAFAALTATGVHGMLQYDQSASGWQTVINITGSGALLWCLWVSDVNGATSKETGLRITIDGTEVFGVSYTGGPAEFGFPVVGALVFENLASTVQGASAEYIPFESSLLIESYMQTTTDLDQSIIYQYVLT